MKMREGICPICESEDTCFLPIASVQPIGEYEIRHCNFCQHRFLPDPPSDDVLEAYYGSFYAEDPRQGRPLGPAWRDWPLARRIRQHLPADARVLEIGSGFGQTLLALPSGYTREGVELSASAVDATSSHPLLHIRHGFFERLEFPESAYDCIIALAVIEHIRHPTTFLAKIARLLRPGGLLVLMTGDYGSWNAQRQGAAWPLYHSAGHLHFFNRRSMEHALGRAGLAPHDWIWAGPTPSSSRLPGPLGRLFHCQTTSLLLPWLQARRGYGDVMYVWGASQAVPSRAGAT